MSNLKIKELISGPFGSGKSTELYKRFEEISKSKSCIFVTFEGFCEFYKHAVPFEFAEKNALVGRTIFLDDADIFIYHYGLAQFKQIIEKTDVYLSAKNSDFYDNCDAGSDAGSLNREFIIASLNIIEGIQADVITKLTISENKHLPEDYADKVFDLYVYRD